jgi:hypothetical protein
LSLLANQKIKEWLSNKAIGSSRKQLSVEFILFLADRTALFVFSLRSALSPNPHPNFFLPLFNPSRLLPLAAGTLDNFFFYSS